jgi:hypothetical protein
LSAGQSFQLFSGIDLKHEFADLGSQLLDLSFTSCIFLVRVDLEAPLTALLKGFDPRFDLGVFEIVLPTDIDQSPFSADELDDHLRLTLGGPSLKLTTFHLLPLLRTWAYTQSSSRGEPPQCRPYITPYTPEHSRMIERWSRSLKEECLGLHRIATLCGPNSGVSCTKTGGSLHEVVPLLNWTGYKPKSEEREVNATQSVHEGNHLIFFLIRLLEQLPEGHLYGDAQT